MRARCSWRWGWHHAAGEGRERVGVAVWGRCAGFVAIHFRGLLSRAASFGHIECQIIAACIFWLLNEFSADYGTWYQLGLGMLAIAVTLLFRQTLWGWVQGKTGLTLFLM